jgi:predicted ATPase/DNA-binding SARP family transcriptional activator
VEVRVIGPVEVVGDDGAVVAVPGRKLQLLVAVLAAAPGRVTTVDRLVDVLYGEDLPSNPANAVQVLVSRLRRRLATAGLADVVDGGAAGYRLRLAPEDVDAGRFAARVAAGRAATDPTVAAAAFGEALALWRGEPLAGVGADAWADAERARLGELRWGAVEGRVEALLATGRHAEVVAELEAATREQPLRERLWAQLVLALYRSGRQADALRAFQDARAQLVDGLGIEPGPELRQLEAAVLAQDPALDHTPGGGPSPAGAEAPGAGPAEPPAPAPVRRRLPRPLTACLGRDREVAELVGLVGPQRLVTLAGPGGAGKTRLAVEVAQALEPATPDGVWMVELVTTADAGSVLRAIVTELGLDQLALAGGAVPATPEGLADVLGDRSAVLVLDNCEQVVDEVAALAAIVLARCPGLRVLATSREALGVPGEYLFPVPPLAPDVAQRLFVERMGAGGVRIGAGGDVPPQVTAVCARLDGLPLAIELAAARARHLDLDDLVGRLDRRFELLVDGPRTAQPRQRTLRAVVDWSYDLLEKPERRVFERLSVFAGGATLAAARRVCADTAADARGTDDADGADGGGSGGAGGAPITVGQTAVTPDEAEAAIGRLADKSLVTLDRSSGRVRVTMLQTLADYAAERLAERGDEEVEVTARRHVAWALDVASTVALGDPGAGRADRVRAAQAEAPNLRRALDWALAHDPILALRLATGLAWHWYTSMQGPTAWRVLSAALDRADAAGGAPPDVLARAWALGGVVGTLNGQGPAALAMADRAVEFERAGGDPGRLAWALFLRATARLYQTDARSAHDVAEARALFEQVGDESALSLLDYQEGVVAGMLGDTDRARRLLERAGGAFRRSGNHLTHIAVLARLGQLAELLDRPEEARDAFREFRALALDAGLPSLTALADGGLASMLSLLGEAEEAAVLADEAVRLSAEGFSPAITGYAAVAAGLVAFRAGDRAGGEAQVREAIGRFVAVGFHGAAVNAWIHLGRAWAELGAEGAADAVRCADAAVAAAERGDQPGFLARARAYRDSLASPAPP